MTAVEPAASHAVTGAAATEPARTRAADARAWSLRRRTGLIFSVLGILLALLAAVMVVAAIQFVTSGNDVIYRWQPATAASQRMLADLVNQESGVRGYALARQPQFLEPYRDYLRQLDRDQATIERLIGGDRELRELYANARRAGADWRREVAEPVIAEIRAGRNPGTAALDAGKVSFDTVRRESRALSDALAARTAQSRQDRTTSGIVAGVSGALMIVLIVAAGVLLWRGLQDSVLGPVERLRSQTRWVAAGATRSEIKADGPSEFTDLGEDVEAMRRQIVAQLAEAEQAHEELRRRSAELARSNEDLQQFAYVASHDLSEPLRKVANFCQLIERQYGDRLDERGRQYVDFAVDGAKRMQILISDLLALSRVGRTTERFVPLDLDRKLDQALAALSDKIDEAGARIERPGRLPIVDGDRSLLISLFENLIGNAIKYRRADVAPVVRIAAEHDDQAGMWTVTVRDNGIGIDPQYAERIFVVFQRLHLRDQYGGTGIGLALCRKIVEFHGGQIWLDPVQSGAGATFRFTIPESRSRAEPRD
jgi:hypothetical protein